MLFHSFYEVSIGFGGLDFCKIILGDMAEWEGTKKTSGVGSTMDDAMHHNFCFHLSCDLKMCSVKSI